MADSKITALTALTSADPANDMIPIVDVSDTPPASGNTKRISINNLLACSPSATLASLNVTGSSMPANGLYLPTTNTLEFSANTLAQYRIAPLGVFSWYDGAGGTRMTLNATGLGVGAVPSASKFLVATGTSAGIDLFRSDANANFSGIRFRNSANSATNAQIGWNGNELRLEATTSFSLATNGVENRINVDGSGNVGIGVTPSAWGSGYKAIQIASSQSTALMGSGNQTELTTNAFFDSAWKYQGAGTVAASRYSQQSGVHYWYSAAAGAANATITDFATAKMTLDASGNLNIGVTSPLINTTRRLSVSGAVAAALQSTGAATVETINVWHTATSGNNIFVDFDTEASVTSRGSISYNRAGGLVAYNTTSDYRAKDIIGPVSDSGSLIDSLKVYVGKMHGATIARPMLVAHEAQEVAPYAVTGIKDEVDADGKDKYQQMDVSSFVPLLIAEIQSLRTRVQTLETR